MKPLTALILISIVTVSFAGFSHANLVAPDPETVQRNPVMERYADSGFDPSILWFFPLEETAVPDPGVPSVDADPAPDPAPKSDEPPEPTIHDPCGPSAPSILGPRQPWLRMLVPGASE